MHRSRWTWIGTLAGALLATGSCGGGKTAQATCDGGTCTDAAVEASGSSSGGFPFSGPSCTTGPTFYTPCWQCVHAACPATEACLMSECSNFFACYCACAATDVGCQNGCGGEETSACEACALSITDCQKASCHATCSTGDGG
jgi:hypothetical protein